MFIGYVLAAVVALTLGVGYDAVDTPWSGMLGARLASRDPVHIVRGRMWKPRLDSLRMEPG